MKQTTLGAGAEFDLIRRFLDARPRVAPDPLVRVGPGDDCTIIGDIALSVDMSVEGVHFRRDWLAADETGYRATAAALSDLAAVAARPIGVLIALALPAADAGEYATSLMSGAAAAAAAAGAAVLGGDVTRSPDRVVIDVVAIGAVAAPVLRDGAVPGDGVWVTGALGGAAAAVSAWRDGREPDPAARQAFARPTPRTREAVWLAARVPLHALIDISDGLAGDAAHIAAASGVQIILDVGAVPAHAAVANRDRAAGAHHGAAGDRLRLALGGGEDYELCVVAPDSDMHAAAAALREEFGVALTRVGDVVAGAGVLLRWPDGSITDAGPGFDHFSGRPA